MPTSTTDASSSFVIRPIEDRRDPRSASDLRRSDRDAAPPSRRYPGRTGEFSTRAGLHPKPWLLRLRRALREDLFTLHYQPIVSLQDGAISHYEALIRLADSLDGSLTPPCAFLPAAERYGLIQQIDRLVIGKVCALMGGELLGESGSTAAARVAVNLSALSITDRGMLAHIERELVRNCVDPDRLVVEVTETAAIGDMRRARAFCEGVHTLGSSVALDDFGAGFGSFQYLKRLPFRYLKIDGDFIRTLPASRKDQLVVQALVGVVQGMGKQTIAEYVGDEPTIGLLRNYGVDYAQGFELGRPRGAVEVFA
ncbi:MAG TPA: EAL domain-containing protein [Solirubrobacteraceae bacterium]|jgi:EAL domain-containing protein (putative c-di-GMP-specific phosphodiesterase class I)|nr:EAL domain-containing protein [Solirubrobacteraceae bacterium]